MPQTAKPRPGSRSYAILNLKPGESLIYEAAPGKSQPLMQHIGIDARRVGVRVSVALLLAIELKTRAVAELVRVTRQGDESAPGVASDGDPNDQTR